MTVTRGANARIRYTTGRTRTVRCADIALTEAASRTVTRLGRFGGVLS